MAPTYLHHFEAHTETTSLRATSSVAAVTFCDSGTVIRASRLSYLLKEERRERLSTPHMQHADELYPQICIKYLRFITCQSNTSKGRGHDRLPNWNPRNGGMLISQPISSCLTNHRELCMSRLLNDQPRRISIYRLQRRPSFGFESSVSSTPMTSGDPVTVPDKTLSVLGYVYVILRSDFLALNNKY